MKEKQKKSSVDVAIAECALCLRLEHMYADNPNNGQDYIQQREDSQERLAQAVSDRLNRILADGGPRVRVRFEKVESTKTETKIVKP